MYRYKHFKSKEYDFSEFAGPKSGEPAVDFQATRLNGEKAKLSDFFGKWIVLETGSITCPIYESKIEAMNELARQFMNVVFLVLYVREAHPGEKIRQHETFEDKLSCAKQAQEVDQDNRTILVDDLNGSAHKLYGSMPNSVYIINPEGKIVFRGDWNTVREVEKVLRERDPEKIYRKDRYSARPLFGGKNPLSVLKRAGSQSVKDFVFTFPAMVYKHVRKLF